MFIGQSKELLKLLKKCPQTQEIKKEIAELERKIKEYEELKA